MARQYQMDRKTAETRIEAELDLDGCGNIDLDTGIPFFNHMLTLFCVHGDFDLNLQAVGDLDVDFHHTVEDVGLVLGECFSGALGDRAGITGAAALVIEHVLAPAAVNETVAVAGGGS